MGIKRALIFSTFCVLAFAASAQMGPGEYAAKWKVIDSLISKRGLPVSALEEVNKLAAIARREKNDPQLTKALIYRLSLEETRSDSGVLTAIKDLEKELTTETPRQPARSILQNILAGLYLRYIEQNRYKFQDRTNTDNFVKTDVATWSMDDFNRKITTLYLASLADEDLLWQVPSAIYSPVILKGDVPGLRPTLFDLMSHTALNYFEPGGFMTGRSTEDVGMDDPAAFFDAAAFAGHAFARADTLSLHYQGLLLLQRLIRRHLSDKTPDALIDIDLERIVYVHQYGINSKKEELYMQMLSSVTDRYGLLPAAAQAWYLQAQQYASQPGVTEEQRDSTGNIKAVAICEKVVAEADSSEGKANCLMLLHNLRQKDLYLKTEKVNIPYRPFRTLVNWRNFSRLYLRLIRVESPMSEPGINVYDSAFWKKLLNRPVYRSLSQDLPETKDYTLHRVEIAIASLPPGNYMLVAGTDANWNLAGATMCVQNFAVSNISFINQEDDYYVLNRESGQPLAGATVQVWDRSDNAGNKAVLSKGEVFSTDEYGHFLLKRKKKLPYRVTLLEITTSGDHFFPTDAGFSIYYPGETAVDTTVGKKAYEATHTQSYLFTDRAIYRPGQTVYFKGITLTKDFDTRKDKVLPGTPIKVALSNANGEKTDSLELTTNEFGSYHGAFRLPDHQLNGRFTIEDANGWGSTTFSVEEYKRPKFYVGYEKQKGSYRVGDSVRITGLAKGYAGNGIDGAKVVYRVVRKARFRYPWMFWRRPMPSIRNTEIQHGEIRTDGQGKFSFVFLALPDKQVSPDTRPEYDYEVSADVTDISGETRSGKTDIVAGYTMIRLAVNPAEGDHLPADSLHRLQVSSTNLSGEPVATDVHLTVYPLQTPQRLIRERLWETPDRFILPEKVFLDSFPHDEYREESKKESWEKGAKVWETTVSAGLATEGPAGEPAGKTSIAVPSGLLAPGWYLIEARGVDKYGQEVVDKQYVELYDGKTGRPVNPQYTWALGEGTVVEPGEKATVSTGSSAGDVFVIRVVERIDGNAYSHFTLNKEKKSTEWAITEADRGGFRVMDAFVKDNRLYTHYTALRVPWTNKELTIRYSTYRDKTQPGSAEKWQLKISGSRGEKASAEVLAAMYDASLDQFEEQGWSAPPLYPSFNGRASWSAWMMFGMVQSPSREFSVYPPVYFYKTYDELLQPAEVGTFRQMLKGKRIIAHNMIVNSGDMFVHAERMKKISDDAIPMALGVQTVSTSDSVVFNLAGRSRGEAAAPIEKATAPPPVQPRRDFRETAFFFPDLRTDTAGNVSFSFTMPEALTTWKWMTLAHTRDLAFGYSEKSVITQKDLMVQPNAPRFLREGDRMELPVKVVNLTDSELTGQVSLQLTDPTTGQTADGWFTNRQANQYFTVAAHQSVVVGFPLDIPYQYNRPLTYRVTAQARNYSDGEEATLPVVSNRMLVTESLPLNMPGDGTRHFTFDKLLRSGSSETLNHHALTVEFTANPAWYAVQALPYLMEYPHECAEQIFNRAYANALATKIAGSSPRLQQIFDQWRTTDTAALLSNLQKDPELKSVLLEETPWVLQGKSETQQKKNIALLFDLGRMSGELESALLRLSGLQSQDGAFPWFKGGYDDRYMTQYILTGIGHLQQLKAIPPELAGKVKTIVSAALPWLDAQLRQDYEGARKADKMGARPLAAGWINPLAAQYLYMRSMFNDYGIPGDVLPAVSYYRKKAQQNWLQGGKQMQAMIALALYRTGDVQTAKDILASLKQNAIRDEEKGMYWKGMEGGYYWYQAPIETQSLLIEAFREIGGDAAIDRDLKTWLLRQKQTHNWPTTKATADACYALMLGGQDWLNAERNVEIVLGNKKIEWPGDTGEAGTGYNKKVFDGPFVNPPMGNITVTMQTKKAEGADVTKGGSPAWGAVYWQYFDMLDRVTPPGQNKSPLKLGKKLFISRNTDRGPVLEPLADNATLKPGDKVVVRIVITVDRDLEYVHMKDMRAACLEPENVISQYKWQGGLGYYESTKDASTDFFFGWLPRGVHVFEYRLFAGQAGNFSNGVTSIECLYAPEFSFHSEGIRVNVEAAPQ